MKTKIYAAMYNPMVYESSFGIISLHKTRKGAETAMKSHKHRKKKEWLKMFPDKKSREAVPFGEFQEWKVFEVELLD